MRLRNLIIIIFIIFLLVLFYKLIVHPNEKAVLFAEEEIKHTNIASIEILNHTNENIVIDDVAVIEQISSFLIKLNSENIDIEEDRRDNPLYYIYITNIGLHANTAIGVYKDSIVYKGKKQFMSSEESSFIIQLLDDKIRK